MLTTRRETADEVELRLSLDPTFGDARLGELKVQCSREVKGIGNIEKRYRARLEAMAKDVEVAEALPGVSSVVGAWDAIPKCADDLQLDPEAYVKVVGWISGYLMTPRERIDVTTAPNSFALHWLAHLREDSDARQNFLSSVVPKVVAMKATKEEAQRVGKRSLTTDLMRVKQLVDRALKLKKGE